MAGAWVDAADGATFAVANPARGDVIAEVADLGRAETARAIAAADDASGPSIPRGALSVTERPLDEPAANVRSGGQSVSATDTTAIPSLISRRRM